MSTRVGTQLAFLLALSTRVRSESARNTISTWLNQDRVTNTFNELQGCLRLTLTRVRRSTCLSMLKCFHKAVSFQALSKLQPCMFNYACACKERKAQFSSSVFASLLRLSSPSAKSSEGCVAIAQIGRSQSAAQNFERFALRSRKTKCAYVRTRSRAPRPEPRQKQRHARKHYQQILLLSFSNAIR